MQWTLIKVPAVCSSETGRREAKRSQFICYWDAHRRKQLLQKLSAKPCQPEVNVQRYNLRKCRSQRWRLQSELENAEMSKAKIQRWVLTSTEGSKGSHCGTRSSVQLNLWTANDKLTTRQAWSRQHTCRDRLFWTFRQKICIKVFCLHAPPQGQFM